MVKGKGLNLTKTLKNSPSSACPLLRNLHPKRIFQPLQGNKPLLANHTHIQIADKCTCRKTFRVLHSCFCKQAHYLVIARAPLHGRRLLLHFQKRAESIHIIKQPILHHAFHTNTAEPTDAQPFHLLLNLCPIHYLKSLLKHIRIIRATNGRHLLPLDLSLWKYYHVLKRMKTESGCQILFRINSDDNSLYLDLIV